MKRAVTIGAFVLIVALAGSAGAQVAGSEVLEPYPPEEDTSHGIGSVALGGGYRSFFGQRYGVADLDLRIGGEFSERFELLANLIFELGSPVPGIHSGQIRAGVSAGAVIGRVRLGAAFRTGVFLFQRITNNSELTEFTISPVLYLSVDLFVRSHVALFLMAEGGADFILSTDTTPIVNVLLGTRFR
jgi:hypothetical protein